MPSGLLQLAVVWCVRKRHQEAAVSPERCYTSDYGCQMVSSYHAMGSASVTLAASQAMD